MEISTYQLNYVQQIPSVDKSYPPLTHKTTKLKMQLTFGMANGTEKN